VVVRVESSKTIFRRKSPNILLASVFLGSTVLASAVLISFQLSKDKAPAIIQPVLQEFDTIQVLVPAEPVPIGTKMKNIKLKKATYPKHQVPENSLQNFDSLAEFVTVAALPANLPVFRENLSQVGYIPNPVQEKIPLGMRAMTIRVDATSAVEGWAGSGSVVDILLIEKDRTTVVAEKVRILSAERSVAPVEGQAAPTVPSTVTLLVTQEQCLSINTAIPLGKIAFALRSSRDEESWSDTEFKSSELLSRVASETLEPGAIRGVLSIKGQDSAKSFALTDGRWVKTEVVPQGFFVNREEKNIRAD
jgi:pilus assembly protein CpaB